MKRKLIKRNKRKYVTVLGIPYEYLSLFFGYEAIKYNSITRYRHRYTVVQDYKKAFITRTKRIYVPIHVTNKSRRSRIKRKLIEYLTFYSIEEFNKKFKLNYKYDDLRMNRKNDI